VRDALFQTSSLATPHRALRELFPTTSLQLNHQDFFRPSRTSAVEPVVDLLIWASSLCVGVKDPLSLLCLNHSSLCLEYSCMTSAVLSSGLWRHSRI
jgi:hypothetical protein